MKLRDAARIARVVGRRPVLAGFAAIVLMFATVVGAGSAPADVQHPSPGRSNHWVGTWSASPLPATPNRLSGPSDLSAEGFDDQTVRNIVYTSVGGNRIRLRLTNTFGSRPVSVGQVTVGLQESRAGLVHGSVHQATFNGGSPAVTIPAGAQVYSDPVEMPVAPLQNLAISIYLPNATGPATYHPGAEQVNYVSSGNRTNDTSAQAYSTTSPSWYWLDGVHVEASRRVPAVVTLGDSITDGFGSTINANNRWPNYLARMVVAHTPGNRNDEVAILNEGISGDRVLNTSPCFGVGTLARLNRDVLAQDGVRQVILLDGTNDIGFSQASPTNLYPGVPFDCFRPNTDVSARDITNGYQQIISQAHLKGLQIFGGTLAPFKGAFYWSPAAEAKRQAVNRWIRTSGAFDGVIDFDEALSDPAHPQQLLPKYDSGDHLHPNDAGYEAMAQAAFCRLSGTWGLSLARETGRWPNSGGGCPGGENSDGSDGESRQRGAAKADER